MLPSFEENSIALKEALAMSIPVLFLNSVIILVEEYNAGIVIGPSAKPYESLIQLSKDLAKMSKNARKLIEDRG